MSQLTRRDFLKLATSAACAVAAAPFTNVATVLGAESENEFETSKPPTCLGRVTNWGVQIHSKPKLTARLIRVAESDEVIPLYEQVNGQAATLHNPVWYRTEAGFIHSAWVQPVENKLNLPDAYWATRKFWGEVTVPYTDTRAAPDPQAYRYMRLYYTSVYRVVEMVMGRDEQWWYRLQDGITWAPGPFVPAAHVRLIAPHELTPVAVGANKRIEVDLTTQLIVAYENECPVMATRTASGFGSFRTPSGTHCVLSKSPASRMTGGVGADFYDLPGVPFPTYFTTSRAGIHGTYWHNDYGRPRSHGCLNVPSPAARWFWRWTEPFAPYEAGRFDTPRGAEATVIKVA